LIFLPTLTRRKDVFAEILGKIFSVDHGGRVGVGLVLKPESRAA
jgi:hypothetical protein